MIEYEIDIPQEKHLTCYWHLDEGEFYDIDFLYGSRDSGKSREVAMLLVEECLRSDYFRFVLGRKTFNTIKDSQWQLIKDVVEEWELSALFDFTSNPLEIKCKNGNKFLCRGFDDPAKIKSIQNPSGAWVEEMNELSQEDWVILITSLRSNKGKIKIYGTFNPEISGEASSYEDFWLYKEYFSHTHEKSFVHTVLVDVGKEKFPIKYRATHTTYQDNPYCDPIRKAHYENLKIHDPYHYQIYALGNWARPRTGKELFHTFSIDKHVKEIPFDFNRHVHLTFDFNVVPYMTMLAIQVWQENERWQVNVYKEYCPEHPRNKTVAVCHDWDKEHTALGYQGKVFIYGDSTSRKANTVTTDDIRHDYDVIFETLHKWITNQSDRVITNQATDKRIDFMNAAFAGDLPIDIYFNPSCKNTINDFLYIKQGPDGKKFKEVARDPATGKNYQRLGHTSDAKEYFITSIFDFIFEDFVGKG
jgi:PBSX family phage terminase large subunit